MVFFYPEAINPLSVIWAAALKMYTVPLKFPARYLSGGATVLRINTGAGGAPSDPWCTGW